MISIPPLTLIRVALLIFGPTLDSAIGHVFVLDEAGATDKIEIRVLRIWVCKDSLSLIDASPRRVHEDSRVFVQKYRAQAHAASHIVDHLDPITLCGSFDRTASFAVKGH
ncbi:hypothetical protein EVAR_86812_1 [Eumeta japonica]|uniref:Secreted protein n=1 Tax=Eumeta variegata TaxID=151549 RepID=A0A4C1VU22_EUMVA|nr:hypothetical protein EVAR_86812_1 [Eumeta japonica]